MRLQTKLPTTKQQRSQSDVLRVLFAPDYRSGLPYQESLAKALVDEQVTTSFLSHYRIGLPLYRGSRDFETLDALHLHWPEAYIHGPKLWRKAQYVADLSLASRKLPLFLTAHNLYPHNRRDEFLMRSAVRFTVRKASAIFVHSARARELYVEEFGATPEKCHKIPFGDHSLEIGSPVPSAEARERLGLPAGEPICIMFGTVSPYKGQEEVIEAWKAVRMPAKLCIVGPVVRPDYAEKLKALSADARDVSLHTGGWLGPADLRLWLSAADAVIFNYRAILTSGAGCLARAFGLPMLFPASLDAVDLGEPHPSVFRYRNLLEDFPALVQQAVSRGLRYDEAAAYREESRWERVAECTARVYREYIH